MKLELHRCIICGTRWLLWPAGVGGTKDASWNLLDKYSKPGSCCDNVALGNQIEHLRDFDLSAVGVPAPQAPPDFGPEQIQLLASAVVNCHMLARRRINALSQRQPLSALLEKELESWQHVLRICEKAGARSQGVLRASVPTEITEGSQPPALTGGDPSPQEPPDPWQPIETAPKDGTPILVGRLDTRAVVSVSWDKERARWTLNGLQETYTHWMPTPPTDWKLALTGGDPAPPSTQKAEK